MSGISQPIITAQGAGLLNDTTSMTGTEGLSNGTEYSFTITAVYSDGTKSPGISTSITPSATVEPPQNLTDESENGEITLNRDVPAENNWFEVYVTFTPEDEDYPQSVGLVPETSSLTINSPDNETEYTFIVTAVDFMGEESTGSEVTATPTSYTMTPINNAAQLFLIDTDVNPGELAGTCRIEKADDESDIVWYNLYWGESESQKITAAPIASIEATGNDLEYVFTEDTAVPAGTTHLLIYSENP